MTEFEYVNRKNTLYQQMLTRQISWEEYLEKLNQLYKLHN